WQDFAATYPYFEHKSVDWEEVYARYQPQFAEPMLADSAFARLSQMMAELRDIHIQFSRSGQAFQFEKRSLYAANTPKLARSYLEPIHYDNNRILYADLAGTRIAYLQIQSFAGSVNNYTDFPTETIVSSLVNKTGLIIDLRDNPGGKEDFALDFASRFISEPTAYKKTRSRLGANSSQFSPWQTQGMVPVEPISVDYPIILLTNRGCYSAAESFVLMMRALPNVWVLGDTTGGATGHPIAEHLPNGWRYTIPSVQVAQLDGQLIEDIGLAPDSVIWMDEASLRAGKDLILEAAMAIF
ncbi:MAG: S41 family peptidase, partial [Bacteroidota bacterium]